MNLTLLLLLIFLVGFSWACVFIESQRLASLVIWMGGLVLGLIYLLIGSEFIAVSQWMLCTLMVVVNLMHAMLVGDLGERSIEKVKWSEWIRPVFGAGAFGLILCLGFVDLVDPEKEGFSGFSGISLSQISDLWVEREGILFSLLGFGVLLVAVGIGYVVRGEWIKREDVT